MRTTALVLLFLIGVINYLDRSTLSIANTSIQDDFGIGATAMGVLLSGFSWAYALAQLPAGGLLDRWGPRRVLGGGLLLWSVAQALGGLAQGVKQLFVTRLIVGAGEAPTYPSNAKVVATWFPSRVRGGPMGFLNASSSVGPAVAPPLLTWLMLTYGWRAMFFVAGAIGIVLAVVWFWLYRDRPSETRAESNPATDDNAGTDDNAEAEDKDLTFRDWARLLRFRTTWGMILGFFGVVYSIYLYLTWLPAYLSEARGLTVADTGLALILPYVAGSLGSLATGFVGDWLERAGIRPMLARKIPTVSGLVLGGLAIIPVALVRSTALALVCLVISQFFMNVASGGGWALASIAGDQRVTASLGSLQNFGGYVGGGFAPIVTGVLVDTTGSFAIALLVASAVALLGALSYVLLVKNKIRLPRTPAPES